MGSDTTLERFAAAYAELAEFLPAYEAAMERRDWEIAHRTGIAPHWNFRTDEEASAHLKIMDIVDREMGFDEMHARREEIERPLDRIVRQILDTPASDIADLVLKANAVATAIPQLWESMPDDLDWPHELVRDLIESVCIVAGAHLIPRPPTKPAAPRSDLN